MWPYPWTHVGTPSHLRHLDLVAATMPSQAHAGAAQEAPDIRQWEGQDVPLVRPSSCNVKGEAGSDPRGHLWVTWGVYLCAGKPPLADIILSHPPDLTLCDSVIGLVIAAMSGNIQYRGAASGDSDIRMSGINRVLLS